MLLQELIKQVGSKGLEGALHANKYNRKALREVKPVIDFLKEVGEI